MPTFETDASPAPQSGRPEAPAMEFRPRKREWKGDLDETFNPAPIPPEAKKSIDQRVNEIMRQCSGPDETFFAVREWMVTAKRIITSIPALFRELFRRKTDNAAADEGDAEAESPEPERAAEQTPVQGDNSRRDNSRQQPPSQAQNQHSRGRRGGRRHTRRGGDGNNHDRGGERDWRENSY